MKTAAAWIFKGISLIIGTLLSRGSHDVTPLESATQVWRQAARVLLLQAALAAAAAAIAALVWGFSAGAWALVGGAVCVVPSALFAFKLSRAALRSGQAFGVAIVIVLGELIKVVLVVALFALAYSQFGGLNAAALLFGFIAAIQGYFFAFLIS
jgi:F0F1-type ATP synthase assembly protein I